MTPNKFKENLFLLSSILEDRNVKDRIVTTATLAVEAKMKNRIFDQGVAQDGSKIGKYSEKPTYIKNKQGLPKFANVGKNGKSKFKNGKSKETRYFGRGYFEYRAKVGRKNNTVDLNLTSSLFLSLKTGTKGGKIVLGFDNKEKGAIMDGHEERYFRIIASPSIEERAIAVDIARSEIIKIAEIL